MSKTIALMAAAAIGIGGAAASTSPASADILQPLVHQGASTDNSAVEQVNWRRSRGFHSGFHRHGFRHHGFRHRDSSRDFAAGIIGFGAGALLGSALAAPRYYHYPQTQAFAYGGHPNSAHVQWCMQRFRSYDLASDTYLNYDGNRYRCNSPYAAW
jgi:hypothetical protein